MIWRFVLAGLLVSLLTQAGRGAVITPSTTTLFANTPNQIVTFNISGLDLIAGEDLNFQINDGTTGPLITHVDILTGTIFDSNNDGQFGGLVTSGAAANRLAVVSTITESGTVPDSGLLATLTLSTVGFGSSSFQLNMLGTLNGNSDLVLPNATTIVPSYPSNTFTVIVPEPDTGVAMLVAGCLLGLRCLKRNRSDLRSQN